MTVFIFKLFPLRLYLSIYNEDSVRSSGTFQREMHNSEKDVHLNRILKNEGAHLLLAIQLRNEWTKKYCSNIFLLKIPNIESTR